ENAVGGLRLEHAAIDRDVAAVTAVRAGENERAVGQLVDGRAAGEIRSDREAAGAGDIDDGIRSDGERAAADALAARGLLDDARDVALEREGVAALRDRERAGAGVELEGIDVVGTVHRRRGADATGEVELLDRRGARGRGNIADPVIAFGPVVAAAIAAVPGEERSIRRNEVSVAGAVAGVSERTRLDRAGTV